MSGSTELEVHQTMRLEEAGSEPAPAEPERVRPENPRNAMLRQISAHYEEKQRGGEIAYGEQLLRDAAERAGLEAPEGGEGAVSEAPEEPPQQDASVSPRVVAPVEPPPSASEGHVAPSPSPPQLRTITIQGQQLQVTDEQLLHLAQVGAYANMAMQQQQRAPPTPQPEPVVHAPEPMLEPEKAASITQRMSYGTPEEQAAALQDLTTEIAAKLAAQQQRIDPVALRREAAADAMQQFQVQADLNTLGREFADVFGDPNKQWTDQERAIYLTRSRVAAANLSDIRQRDAFLGQARPAIDQYREAARMVRDAFAPPQSQPTVEASTAIQAAPQADRLERKRAAPRNPVAVSRAASLGDPTPRAPSNAEIVDTMRKARGQMPMH